MAVHRVQAVLAVAVDKALQEPHCKVVTGKVEPVAVAVAVAVTTVAVAVETTLLPTGKAAGVVDQVMQTLPIPQM